MTKEDFWAKDKGSESIEEHTNELLNLFDAFLKLYGRNFSEKEIFLIRQAIIYHDLGKMNSAFQHYLYNKAGKKVPQKFSNLEPYERLEGRDIPHGILSGAFIRPKLFKERGYSEDDITVLVTAICNHHSRSLECKESIDTIQNVIDQDLKRQALNYGLDYCMSRPILKYNKLLNEYDDFNNDLWMRFALVKGILNKMDYAASAHNETAEYPPDDAKIKVKEKFSKKQYEFRECQRYLLDKQNENIIMTASTGMGKTEAALIWAGMDKTFYTLPYKVSINAIYQRIIENDYYDKNKVVVLHSEALKLLLEYEQILQNCDDPNQIKRKYEKIKNFSYPFTVCTVDQLFLFSLRPLGSEIMAATLSYSKVIIDEIQAYNPKLLAEILFGLYIVNQLKGKFMIMTATLPPFIIEYFKEKSISCCFTPSFFTKEIRHVFCIERDFDYKFIEEKAKCNKVLIICNTVSKAQQVFEDLQQYDLLPNLLHSRFVLKDRKSKENQILKFASNESNEKSYGIWITTQLVEASLDIDFDLLFTEMSTADSLLQRMGRCYRNRVYRGQTPNIYVYDTRNGVGKNKAIYDEYIYERSLKFLDSYAEKPFSEQSKQEYINKVYDTQSIMNSQYYKDFYKELMDLEKLRNCFLSKDLARKEFREINSIAVIPYEFADQARELEEKINNEKNSFKIHELREELRNFTLSVNPYNKNKYKISQEKIFEYPICNNQYNSIKGLIDYDQTDNLC